MPENVHIVPHMHWDREWYFTAEESKILLVNDLEEVLTMLESCPDYPYYVLDGQTAVLEDYLNLVPEHRPRIQKLVAAGRLIIGPWYTQTDEMVVGGESIVRNLLYGLKDCRAFGPAMMIGYLPDSFGQSARMPQILNGFGIKRCMFWRGTSERMGTDKTEFTWHDTDGSSVVVQLLPLGYAIGKYLPEEGTALKERMDKYLPVLERGATAEHILLPNGHDQMPVQKNIFTVMDKLAELYPDKKFFLSRYEQLFDEIEKNPLPELQGEFLDGKYMRVHRSIFSSRSDLKSANTRIENKITNLLEPLAAVAWSLGFAYHHGLMEEMWKELMKNHAHDSIGCCCSDKVHRAIADRFFIAEEKADGLIDFYMRKIADASGCEESVTVFNLLPYSRKGVVTAELVTKRTGFSLMDADRKTLDYEIQQMEIVDAGLIDRQLVHYEDYDPFRRYVITFYDSLPAMGYKTYTVEDGSSAVSEHGVKADEDAYLLENSFYAISVERNGTLTVLDKKTDIVYHDVLLVEDGSDDGDGYDYSPAPGDVILTSADVTADISVKQCRFTQFAEIRYRMQLPADLSEREHNLRNGWADICLSVELEKKSPLIRLHMEIDNQAKDHRMRLLIPSGLPVDGRDEGILTGGSLSDNQFGQIRRPLRDSAMDVWEQERWSERPDSIYPFLSYVRTDSVKGFTAYTNSIREYEVTGEYYDRIALTLFRCVGVLGKEELLRRPGRPSGIKMATPDSQMVGMMNFELAISTNSVHVDLSNPAGLAKEYLTPFISYNYNGYHAMKLNPAAFEVPRVYSLLEVEMNGAVMSVLKKAEEQEGLIIRLFHGGDGTAEVEISGDRYTVAEATLAEIAQAKNVAGETGGIPLEAAAHKYTLGTNEIRTFLLTVNT